MAIKWIGSDAGHCLGIGGGILLGFLGGFGDPEFLGQSESRKK
jgi:hypothetical protein